MSHNRHQLHARNQVSKTYAHPQFGYFSRCLEEECEARGIPLGSDSAAMVALADQLPEDQLKTMCEVQVGKHPTTLRFMRSHCCRQLDRQSGHDVAQHECLGATHVPWRAQGLICSTKPSRVAE